MFCEDRVFSAYSYALPCLSSATYGLWDSTELRFFKNHSVNLSSSGSGYKDNSSILIPKFYNSMLAGTSQEIEYAILSIDQQAPNYYHFLSYVLPDVVEGYKRSERQNFNSTIVLADSPKYVQEYLDILGINRPVATIRNNPILLRKAIGGDSYYQHSTHDTFDSLIYIRKLIFESIGHLLADSSYPKKVYIERLDSNNGSVHRKIYPQEIFRQDLIKSGWQIVHLEKLSVIQQLKLFYNLDCVMGVHGAGFTNMLAMQPQSKLIELCHNSGCNPVFQIIGKKIGIQVHTHKVSSVLDLHKALPEYYIQLLRISPQSLPLEYTESIRNLLLNN